MDKEVKSRNMNDLLVDIGNTDIVAGVRENGTLSDNIRCTSDVDPDSFFERARHKFFDRAIVSCVVPHLTEKWTSQIEQRFGTKAYLCSADSAAELFEANVDDVESIGSDRIADAVAARHLYGNNCIVVDFGTATNIEYIDEEGIFQGGILMPGIWSGMKGLAASCEKLPQVRIEWPDNVIGKNTQDCIASGLLYGEAARIDGLVDKIVSEQAGTTEPNVIATGGFCELVGPLCKRVNICDKLLTLKGLGLILDNLQLK